MSNRFVLVGAIWTLDPEILRLAPGMKLPPSLATRPGPFACVEAIAEASVWAELTTEPGIGRVSIPGNLIRRACGRLKNEVQYLNDGTSTYCGENTAFVEALYESHLLQRKPNPYLAAEGVSIILAEVRRCGGNLLSQPRGDAA